MADATLTITQFPYPNGVTNDQRTETIRGTFTISAGHYPQGGFSLNWGLLESVKAIPFSAVAPSSTGTIMPIDVDVKSVKNGTTTAGVGPSGVVYAWDNVLGNLHVFIANNGVSANSGPLIELGSAAIPGWVINDTIQFRATFSRI